MIHQPQLLILDEPTAGVDLEIRHNLWHYLKEINSQGTTIILTTHYLEEAEQLCRTIAIIPTDGFALTPRCANCWINWIRSISCCT